MGVGSKSDYLAKGFGLLYRGGGDLVGNINLIGTVIDGILYGDTTDIVTSIDDSPALPDDFKLFQNYPNPFNPSTNIKYYLPESGTVKLVIYNVLGQELKILVNEFQDSGSYSINANLLNYSSGFYIYRLNFAGERGKQFSSVKKMILVR